MFWKTSITPVTVNQTVIGAPESHDSSVHVAFEAIEKSYKGAVGGALALKDISFSVARGKVFGIIGRSGAGKSTLLRSINMLERPSAGRVLVDGVDVSALDEEGLVRLRRRIGMIFQHFNLLSSKTVRDNVGLPMKAAGASKADIKRRVDELLELVGLTDKAEIYPAKLSGGQKQRVGIARALALSPEILLCDEATSALDPETTRSILDLLRDINERLGLTVILITHDMAVIREICDDILVLDNGRIAEMGEVWRVFGAPKAEATRALLRHLQFTLPPDLANRLLAKPPLVGGSAILGLRFTGADQPQGVSLQELLRVAPGATLLHGGIDRIQGHAQGFLLASVPIKAFDQTISDPYFSDSIKVLGYVADTH